MYKYQSSKYKIGVYKESLSIRNQFEFIQTHFPIRTNDEIEYFDFQTNTVIKATVKNHSYESIKGQHTFTLLKSDGIIRLIKGRNLYLNIVSHTHKGQS